MLVDSNILIYSLQAAYPQLRALVAHNLPALSAISYLETLGFPRITQQDINDLQQLFGILPILDIDRPILDRAVSLRQQRRMSLGDAIIAATALVHDKTLVTRNTSDFRWIPDLRLLDPLATPSQP
ncbi:MAG: PilT protein domain protein [Phycisphaerales bacterium]|nr:PilT protein domain protein [Phycisphaerales bacterium]